MIGELTAAEYQQKVRNAKGNLVNILNIPVPTKLCLSVNPYANVRPKNENAKKEKEGEGRVQETRFVGVFRPGKIRL